MKILYLCQDHGIPIFGRRGCSTHVRETCKALQNSGHDITVLCSQIGHDDIDKSDLEVIEVVPRRLRVLGYDMRNIWHNYPYYRAALEIIESRQIDAVYERFSLYSLAGTWLQSRYALPRILEVNAFLSVEQHEKLHFLAMAQKAEKYVALRAPALAVVSRPLHDSLVSLGVQSERIFTMPMAVDVNHFSHNPALGRAARERWNLGNRYVIGYIGTLSGWHGITLMHDMAAQIRKLRDDFAIFVVGGEVSQVERHRERAKAAGLQDHLIFAGSVSYGEVPGCINAMDVALVPDTNYWTCPTKMFEYQASQVPTIAPKYPAVLNSMDNGEEGLLFEPKDVAGAVRGILALADQPELRRVMGEKARRRVTSTHSWQHNITRIIRLFDSMRSGKYPMKGMLDQVIANEIDA